MVSRPVAEMNSAGEGAVDLEMGCDHFVNREISLCEPSALPSHLAAQFSVVNQPAQLIGNVPRTLRLHQEPVHPIFHHIAATSRVAGDDRQTS